MNALQNNSSSSQNSETGPIWTPDEKRIKNSNLFAFKTQIESETGEKYSDYHELWQWSCDNPAYFWDKMWDFAEIVGEKGQEIFVEGENMRESVFFPEASLNFAENLLRRRDDAAAIIFRDERGHETTYSFSALYQQVSRWQQAFQEFGVTRGDRVAAYMPNMPETLFACLAASSLGAIFASASPDFGEQGLIDRFSQIEPKILVATDGYFYNGKIIDCRANIAGLLSATPSIERTILIPFAETGSLDGAMAAPEMLDAYTPKDVSFCRMPFDAPLFIMFSSGTTGKPKCIVHGQGGTLITLLKEHLLHCDTRPDDRIFYFTTCGWMMWNWLIPALACGACILLYDGSPFYPDGNTLWSFAADKGCTLFGTSAKYIDACRVNAIRPKRDFDLSSLRSITSTGSPLVHSGFDYIYEHVKGDVHLASIYGGTDIISASFGLGNPLSPVYRGELQGPGLGTAVAVFDDNGRSLPPGGGAGELVCTRAFPSMPVQFWGDSDGSKYTGAYFEKFDGVWAHGDWVERTIHNGLIVHGRSDATLNPGGVRIGTAEIYRQVEKIDGVVESIAVGQQWEDDVRVVLFVVLKDGLVLTDELQKQIRTQIRSGATPRHVPAKIIQVSDIPRTKSGKITELAVKDVIHGRAVKNKTALANPEALDYFSALEELKS